MHVEIVKTVEIVKVVKVVEAVRTVESVEAVESVKVVEIVEGVEFEGPHGCYRWGRGSDDRREREKQRGGFGR